MHRTVLATKNDPVPNTCNAEDAKLGDREIDLLAKIENPEITPPMFWLLDFFFFLKKMPMGLP